MKIVDCPYCSPQNFASVIRPQVHRDGFYKRKSDHRIVRRFKCLGCSKRFSFATEHPCYRQNKRQLNDRIHKLFCSGVSQRRIAKLLRISRTTVAKKLKFLGAQAQLSLVRSRFTRPSSQIVEFDDMETFEHTKLKPLSITLAVESKSRRILGFEVSRMPAKGHLAGLARKKYPPRPDERARARDTLFKSLQVCIYPYATIKSDQNPHYPMDVKKHFPLATHETHPGQRGSIVGQGELKKIRFDPLFSLNHTCAMLRANINRLFRKTWCTTKNPDRLKDHIAIYVEFHNKVLLSG